MRPESREKKKMHRTESWDPNVELKQIRGKSVQHELKTKKISRIKEWPKS